MKRILIRAAQNPLINYEAFDSTKKIGGNSGNLLYANGVARTLASSRNILTFGGFRSHLLSDKSKWIDHVNKNYDHYVIPLSNIFRIEGYAVLENLTYIIKNLSIPVTVVGVGAQATADAYKNNIYIMSNCSTDTPDNEHEIKNHNKIVLNFCKAVLQKSNSIGVRGEYTKNYLLSLGIEPNRITVIGCPSLYTWGPNLRITDDDNNAFCGKNKKFNPQAHISMNIDHRVIGIERMIYANLEKYQNLTSPCQDSKSARMIISQKDYYDINQINFKTPIHMNHEMVINKKLIYYQNPWSWINQLSEKEFVFGTRLHGNIAGILGKTPSHLIAHDARTLELAKLSGIPYTIYEKNSDFLAEDLYHNTDYTKFNDLMPKLFNNYLNFLRNNNLTTIYDTDHGHAINFDKEISKLKSIPPIYPV